jgi:putative flippase GtrA
MPNPLRNINLSDPLLNCMVSRNSPAALTLKATHATKRQGYLMWIVGFVLLLLAGVSYLLMYIDSLHGGHTAWPVYLFAGVGIVCAGVWGYIASTLV